MQLQHKAYLQALTETEGRNNTMPWSSDVYYVAKVIISWFALLFYVLNIILMKSLLITRFCKYLWKLFDISHIENILDGTYQNILKTTSKS